MRHLSFPPRLGTHEQPKFAGRLAGGTVIESACRSISAPAGCKLVSRGYLTPTVIEAELFVGLLSVPLKIAFPEVETLPAAVKVTVTVMIMA